MTYQVTHLMWRPGHLWKSQSGRALSASDIQEKEGDTPLPSPSWWEGYLKTSGQGPFNPANVWCLHDAMRPKLDVNHRHPHSEDFPRNSHHISRIFGARVDKNPTSHRVLPRPERWAQSLHLLPSLLSLTVVTPSDPGKDCELTQFEAPCTLYCHIAQTPIF